MNARNAIIFVLITCLTILFAAILILTSREVVGQEVEITKVEKPPLIITPVIPEPEKPKPVFYVTLGLNNYTDNSSKDSSNKVVPVVGLLYSSGIEFGISGYRTKWENIEDSPYSFNSWDNDSKAEKAIFDLFDIRMVCMEATLGAKKEFEYSYNPYISGGIAVSSISVTAKISTISNPKESIARETLTGIGYYLGTGFLHTVDNINIGLNLKYTDLTVSFEGSESEIILNNLSLNGIISLYF